MLPDRPGAGVRPDNGAMICIASVAWALSIALIGVHQASAGRPRRWVSNCCLEPALARQLLIADEVEPLVGEQRFVCASWHGWSIALVDDRIDLARTSPFLTSWPRQIDRDQLPSTWERTSTLFSARTAPTPSR